MTSRRVLVVIVSVPSRNRQSPTAMVFSPLASLAVSPHNSRFMARVFILEVRYLSLVAGLPNGRPMCRRREASGQWMGGVGAVGTIGLLGWDAVLVGYLVTTQRNPITGSEFDGLCSNDRANTPAPDPSRPPPRIAAAGTPNDGDPPFSRTTHEATFQVRSLP